MLLVSMPKSETLCALVDMATKCLATSVDSAFLRNHSRAALALLRVSNVVNVFEAMINRVVSGSHFYSVVETSVGSIFETK